MEELYRTNDPVLLSFIRSVLVDAGIEALIFDNHTSFAEGSIGAIQQRIMVPSDDKNQAIRLIRDAGVEI